MTVYSNSMKTTVIQYDAPFQQYTVAVYSCSMNILQYTVQYDSIQSQYTAAVCITVGAQYEQYEPPHVAASRSGREGAAA